MSSSLKGYEKAGRVMKLLGWVGGVLAVLIAVTGVLVSFGAMKSSSPSYAFRAMVGGMFFLLVSWFYIFLGRSVKEHKNWARIVAIILNAINAIAFPVGTLIGGYILWQLHKDWDEPK